MAADQAGQFALPNQIASRIQPIHGVQAVVLGGSRARRTESPDSDIDLAIYYYPHTPLDLAALNRLATELDDDHRAGLLTPIGGWGRWINGGGWLNVYGIAVDFLYRDLAKVEIEIADCLKGKVQIDYQPGHPHAFTSAIYLAEIAVCQPLADPNGAIAGLKTLAIPYPAALRQALIERFFWEVGFSIATARKAANRGDAAYVTGCVFRGIACLLQTLFAANAQYWLNEKGALDLAARFPLAPADLKARAHAVTALLAPEPQSLNTALNLLEELTQETERLLNAGLIIH
jgi:predicted nucleotidyltransferase